MSTLKKTFHSDIDIDIADRDALLNLIYHTPASIRNKQTQRKHNSGIYVSDIPYDPIMAAASIGYEEAEQRGYTKIDILNMSIYSMVNSNDHLDKLMAEPNWEMLKNKDMVDQLIHLNKHYSIIKSMPEPVDDINKLAMLLALIRPAKRHLVGKRWSEVEKTIWDAEADGYVFKRSHSIAYSHLVVVHMNLLSGY